MDTSNNSSEKTQNNNEQMVISTPSYCNNHVYAFFCIPIMYSNGVYLPIPTIHAPIPMNIHTPTPIPATLPTIPEPILNNITTQSHIPATKNECPPRL